MQITLDMPNVAQCGVTECVYNVSKGCHARAITVGDGVHPGCDTFMPSSTHVSTARQIAGVGACKVSGCIHNRDFECGAASIDVGHSGGSVECLTFSSRS